MNRILITGGSGGIGKDITHLIEKEILSPGGTIRSTSSKDLDIRNPVIVKEYILEFKPNLIINLSAASNDGILQYAPMVEHQINVNILGNINLMKSFIRTSIVCQLQRAKFIYISSILSEKPVPGAGIYSACKAFNDNLIRTAALENAKYGLTFNSIQLGYFGSGLCEKLSPEMKEKVLKQIPLHRWGTPGELVALIKLIVDNDYITGQNIKLAGGL